MHEFESHRYNQSLLQKESNKKVIAVVLETGLKTIFTKDYVSSLFWPLEVKLGLEYEYFADNLKNFQKCGGI